MAATPALLRVLYYLEYMILVTIDQRLYFSIPKGVDDESEQTLGVGLRPQARDKRHPRAPYPDEPFVKRWVAVGASSVRMATCSPSQSFSWRETLAVRALSSLHVLSLMRMLTVSITERKAWECEQRSQLPAFLKCNPPSVLHLCIG